MKATETVDTVERKNGTPIAAARRRPARRWLLIVVALLVGHAALMMVAVTIATRDRSFAVTPDYYGKAIHWDQLQAERRASQKLGWSVAVQASPRVSPLGKREVTFVLTDATGKAVPGAVLEVQYFHHSHGHDIETANLTASNQDGSRFSAELPMRYAGNWEFEFHVKAGEKSFVATQTVFLSPSPLYSGERAGVRGDSR